MNPISQLYGKFRALARRSWRAIRFTGFYLALRRPKRWGWIRSTPETERDVLNAMRGEGFEPILFQADPQSYRDYVKAATPARNRAREQSL